MDIPQGNMVFSLADICVAPQQNTILLTDRSYQTVRIVDTKTMSLLDKIDQTFATEGICLRGENILIADKRGQKILILDNNYNCVSVIHTPKFHPRFICTAKRGYIIVSTDENCVLIIDASGNIIKTFGSKWIEDGQFSLSRAVCTNSLDEIIVGDFYNNRVQIFDRDGNFLHTFGSRGSAPHQFYEPHGLCVDWDDNILVTDHKNKRISVFTRMGIPIQQIPVPTQPLAICLLENKIIISTCNDRLMVFSN